MANPITAAMVFGVLLIGARFGGPHRAPARAGGYRLRLRGRPIETALRDLADRVERREARAARLETLR